LIDVNRSTDSPASVHERREDPVQNPDGLERSELGQQPWGQCEAAKHHAAFDDRHGEQAQKRDSQRIAGWFCKAPKRNTLP
jgi:hypothetical protein